jgi:hypothetical protein
MYAELRVISIMCRVGKIVEFQLEFLVMGCGHRLLIVNGELVHNFKK